MDSAVVNPQTTPWHTPADALRGLYHGNPATTPATLLHTVRGEWARWWAGQHAMGRTYPTWQAAWGAWVTATHGTIQIRATCGVCQGKGHDRYYRGPCAGCHGNRNAWQAVALRAAPA